MCARKTILSKFGNLYLTLLSNYTTNTRILTCLKMKWRSFSSSMEKSSKIWPLIALSSTLLTCFKTNTQIWTWVVKWLRLSSIFSATCLTPSIFYTFPQIWCKAVSSECYTQNYLKSCIVSRLHHTAVLAVTPSLENKRQRISDAVMHITNNVLLLANPLSVWPVLATVPTNSHITSIPLTRNTPKLRKWMIW